MPAPRTEYPFRLPKGYIDTDGEVHHEGTMRLATARDELEPLGDPKVRDADDPYLSVIVLARVITRLGPHTRLAPSDVEKFFAADLAHLQDVYAAINYGTQTDIDRILQTETGGGRPAPLTNAPETSAAAQAPAQVPPADAAPLPGSPGVGSPDAGAPAGGGGVAAPAGAGVPAAGQTAGSAVGQSAGQPAAAATGHTATPVSDAARAFTAQGSPAPVADVEAPDPAVEPLPDPARAPRRSRIEEVGRSSGRPG